MAGAAPDSGMRFKNMQSKCFIPLALSSSVTFMPESDSATSESLSAGASASSSSTPRLSASVGSSLSSSASFSSVTSAVALSGTASGEGSLSTFLSLTAFVSAVAEVKKKLHEKFFSTITFPHHHLDLTSNMQQT